MIENKLKTAALKPTSAASASTDASAIAIASGQAGSEEAEQRAMGVRALVAMIEIWMSDLWYVLSQNGAVRVIREARHRAPYRVIRW